MTRSQLAQVAAELDPLVITGTFEDCAGRGK